MSIQDNKKMHDREAVRTVIQQWNANRLDLFALSEPDENLLFHGVMRFYFQDAGQKVATKCIRVASDATVSDVIETLIEKFRPDMRMLSVPNYALYEVHANGEERRLNPDEKPLLVQLNWHIDDREGRFLLRNIDQKTTTIESTDNNFKRKLSKREKKEQKKKEKLAKLNSDSGSMSGANGGGNGIGNGGNDENHVAEKLYTELPETSFTRSISNPEAVMRRRRQQKLEKKLQQFRSRDGGPDTGGTLKIYGESLCRDVPYKTLLLSIRDCAQAVVREMLTKYGLEKADPLHYCLVQVNSDATEYILDDDECPLSILMNHPTSRGSIMFHVRRRPADSQPRRRKKKPLGVPNGTNNICEREGPMLVEVTHSGDGGRRVKLGSDPVEVGSANTNSLQLFGPSIQPRHCLISLLEGVCTVTPLHTDALTFVNGHHITQPTILHNGSVVMFGRVSSYRFIDSPSDGRYNLALSQSQLDSACLYESRSPQSPQSWNEDDRSPTSGPPTTGPTSGIINNNNNGPIISNENKPIGSGNVSNTGSAMMGLNTNDNDKIRGPIKETDFAYDPEGNIETETKSISSIKSGGSNNQESRTSKVSMAEMQQGQEPILPAVLEFPETHQENFLRQVITELDVNAPNFKLSPVYTLYLCARYRASTHYRPELQPTERAHKLTIFLHHVANLIYSIIQDQYNDPRVLAFWMANSSEFLHFLKSDRHISAFSVQAQEVLAESVQSAFRNLVNCFRVELSQTLNQFLSENIDHESAAGFVLTVLGSAMALLRRCRVNAALTIQLFSQLFHYINVICFNTIVANSHMCTAEWGKVMLERLQLLELWAERQGLELAADCHLAKINQCSQFLQAPKTSVEEIQKLACSCFRLNSLQMAALLQQEQIPRNLIDTAIRMAESVADELTRADGREVRLEESPELHLALLLPDDGFSCDVVRGIPSGLVDFLNPLQAAAMCRLAAQPTSIGLWTVYMHQFNTRSPSSMSNKLPQPEVQVIKLHKNSNGMGLSIVAAKGAGQERLGIYIKSVVPGGAADADGRLQAGDQLLRVDGQSLIGITQERAADYLVRTGPIVTLEVAKQGAIYHGLATLLQQPSPVIQRDSDDIIPIIPPYPITLNYGSGSDESIHSTSALNTTRYETFPIFYSNYPHRRRSSSSLQEELCARGEKLHIDPRYRDTRPIARSSSSLILAAEHNTSPLRTNWDVGPAPSIFIEQYNDDEVSTHSDNVSNESITQLNLAQVEAHQPLNEDSLASCSGDKIDQIPFIDDEIPQEEEKPYVPPDSSEFFRRSRSSVSSVTSAGAGGIIKESRSNSGCRKTVSFDLIDDNSSSTSFPSRKSRTFDTISSTNKMNSNNISFSNLISKNETVSLEDDNDNNSQEKVKEPVIKTSKRQTFSIEQYDDLDLDLSELKSTSSSSRSSCIGNRRMSERDINRIGDGKTPLGQHQQNQMLPNSKSVPALHHVGGGAMANSKSRSIHSLVNNNNNDGGFYQNLSVYRAQNQSQPILNERHQISSQQGSIAGGMNQQMPSNVHQQQQQQHNSNVPTANSNLVSNAQQSLLNRPTSAYYHSANPNTTNNSMPSPNSMMSYNMSASSTNLANGMSPNLSTMQQSGQHPINRLKMNQQNFNNRDLQTQQQNLRINSMMAPSMPNIAAAHSTMSYPGQISSSQSMQNVNMIQGGINLQPQSLINSELSAHQQQFQQNGPLHLITSSQGNQHFDSSPVQYHHHTMNPTAAQIRGQGKMIEIAEHAARRLHGNDNLNIHVGLTGKLPMHSPQNQSQLPQMSPIKQLPPTAPKPQHIMRNQSAYSQNQPETIHEEQHSTHTTPPLPPTTTHPLFKNTSSSTQNINYVASTLDPPKAAYYPVASAHHQHHPKNYVQGNPWEREEREKEHEIRREHIRQWRDHQIAELSAIPNRTPQQEEQLKTLVLERDFERRAQETEEQEDDNEGGYNKDNVQEVIRLAHQNSTVQAPVTNFRQVDVKVSSQTISGNNNNNLIAGNEAPSISSSSTITNTTTTTTAMADAQQSYQSFSIQQSQIVQTPTTVQPKGILKNNRHGIDSNTNTPGSPSKSQKSASFADDHKIITQTEITTMSQLTKDITNLDINGNADQIPLDITRDAVNALDNGGPPPPPPERNSSYLVMSQQQQKVRNPALIKTSNVANEINTNSPPSLISGTGVGIKQRPNLLNTSNSNILNNNSINNNNNNNNIMMSPHTPATATTTTTHSMNSPHIPISSTTTQNILNMNRDNKRVSFHDEENNFVLSQEYNLEQSDLDIIREDPNRFIQETNALLQTPTTPDADMWNTTVQSTPGVIGAQEVYRDPRTRRLAEQQQKQQQNKNEAVPEKLSFKEKMKMFALESGEDQTPKDKLKISRAQRDIDAVH